MRHLRRLLELPSVERRLLAEAWLRLVVVTTALRWGGYRRVSRWVPASRQRIPQVDEIARAQQYATWIIVAARRQPFEALCLAKSLTLHAWLRAEGVPSELRIGVVKADAQLAAHAWVELDGIPVNDNPDAVATFTPLAQMPGRTADFGQRTAPHAAPVLR